MVTYRDIYRYVYIEISVDIYMSLLCQLTKTRATSTVTSIFWFLILFSNERNHDSLGKWLILRLELEINENEYTNLLCRTPHNRCRYCTFKEGEHSSPISSGACTMAFFQRIPCGKGDKRATLQWRT